MQALHFNIDHIAFSYGYRSIIEGFSFQIESPKTIAITGENGAGKTTLLALLAKILKPTKGEIRISKEKMFVDLYQLRRQSGISIKDYYLLQDFSLMENLHLKSMLLNLPPSDVSKSLVSGFGLEKIKNNPLRTYSEGEIKKASIVNALFLNPFCLFLDEPTNALDQSAVDFLSSVIKEKNRLCFLTTHDQKWAQEVSDEIWQVRNRGVHVL